MKQYRNNPYFAYSFMAGVKITEAAVIKAINRTLGAFA
jgi:hypothetical protein